MREYRTREEAENDPGLNLMIIWGCNRCKIEYEEYPGWNEGGNEGGNCSCGGQFEKVGETYQDCGPWR